MQPTTQTRDARQPEAPEHRICLTGRLRLTPSLLHQGFRVSTPDECVSAFVHLVGDWDKGGAMLHVKDIKSDASTHIVDAYFSIGHYRNDVWKHITSQSHMCADDNYTFELPSCEAFPNMHWVIVLVGASAP